MNSSGSFLNKSKSYYEILILIIKVLMVNKHLSIANTKMATFFKMSI